MKLSEKIQALRKEKGLSQEALAEKLNVSRQAVSKWEMEQAQPDIDKIIALSEIFCVTTDYLLLLEIDKKNSTENTINNNSIKKSFIVGLAFFVLGFLSIIIYCVVLSIDFTRQFNNGFVGMKIILYAGLFLSFFGLVLIFQKQVRSFISIHLKTKKSILVIIGFFLIIVTPIVFIILANQTVNVVGIKNHLTDGSYIRVETIISKPYLLYITTLSFLLGLVLIIISHIRYFVKRKR